MVPKFYISERPQSTIFALRLRGAEIVQIGAVVAALRADGSVAALAAKSGTEEASIADVFRSWAGVKVEVVNLAAGPDRI